MISTGASLVQSGSDASSGEANLPSKFPSDTLDIGGHVLTTEDLCSTADRWMDPPDGFKRSWFLTLDMARVPLLTQSDLPEEYQDLFGVDEEDPTDIVVNVHRAMANNPRVMDAWVEWARTLYDEVGAARTRELAILAVARATDSWYVWHQHVSVALEEGVSQSEILAISDQAFDEFTPAETAVLEYVTAVATEGPDDRLHDELSRHYDDSMVLALVFLAAEYVAVGRVIDALAVELAAEFVGWQLQHCD